MRVSPAALLVACLALSGCSGGGRDPSDAATTPTPTFDPSIDDAASPAQAPSPAASTGPSPAPKAPPANHRPTAQLTASADHGATPLRVNFTADGADVDGDALSWSLDFGDGNRTTGTALPAILPHEFARVGSYNATLTVQDGKLDATAVVHLKVNSSAPALVFSGAVAVDCSLQCGGCDSTQPNEATCFVGDNGLAPGAAGCASFTSAKAGVDCVWVAVPANLVGHAFTVTSTKGDPDIDFLDACSAAEAEQSVSVWNSGPEAGVVPAGMGCLVAWEWNAVGADGSTIKVVIQ
jgi:PKD repeat protein